MKKIPTGVVRLFRNYPVVTGCVVFCLIPVLAWVAFDAYSRIRFASTVRNIEREGIICRYSDFRERYVSSPEAVLAEFDRLGKAMSVAYARYSFDETRNLDVDALVAGETELLKEADAFLAQNPQLVLFHDEKNEMFPIDLVRRDNHCCDWLLINLLRSRQLARGGAVQ